MATLIEISSRYVGQKENPGNQGFKNSDFDKKMRSVGFVNGAPWCMFFVMLCVKEAYPDRWTELKPLFSGSCLKTLNNFKKAGYTILAHPEPNAICIWQSGSTANGHTAICASGASPSAGGTFATIEGNTNAAGGREGDTVAHKVRKNTNVPVDSGLWVRGFLKI